MDQLQYQPIIFFSIEFHFKKNSLLVRSIESIQVKNSIEFINNENTREKYEKYLDKSVINNFHTLVN